MGKAVGGLLNIERMLVPDHDNASVVPSKCWSASDFINEPVKWVMGPTPQVDDVGSSAIVYCSISQHRDLPDLVVRSLTCTLVKPWNLIFDSAWKIKGSNPKRARGGFKVASISSRELAIGMEFR